jgi:hypothetical protein
VGAVDFRDRRPSRPEEVDSLLARFGDDACVLGGGTGLLVQLRNCDRHPPEKFCSAMRDQTAT